MCTSILDSWRSILNSNDVNFHKLINLPALLPHLKSKQLLSEREEDILTNDLHTKQDRVTKLLQFIPNKGRQGFLRFMQAIREEDTHLGHKELCQTILQDVPANVPLNQHGKYNIYDTEYVIFIAW